MKIIWKSLLAIGTITSLNVAGQTLPSERDLTAFSWEISVPTSNNYINATSLSGWRFEYRKGIKHNISVGVAISWSAFDEYVGTTTYSTPNKTRAITTDMIRQVYALPLTLIGHYYMNTKSKMFEPYLGVGLGTQYAEHKAYLNVYEIVETNWAFVARPEIGTLLKFSNNSPVRGLLSVGFNLSTNKNEAFDVDGWKHLTFNIGIGIGNGL